MMSSNAWFPRSQPEGPSQLILKCPNCDWSDSRDGVTWSFGPQDPRSTWLDWPLAYYSTDEYDFSELESHLWENARMMIVEGKERHADGSRLGKHVAALCLGTAVELLAKCYLVSINPALIAFQGDVNSTLIFSGDIEYLPTNAKARTRQGAEVLGMARRMIEASSGHEPWASEDEVRVLEARNAVAHLGLLRDDEKAGFLFAAERVINGMLPHVRLAGTASSR
jgi:hypothetical protein